MTHPSDCRRPPLPRDAPTATEYQLRAERHRPRSRHEFLIAVRALRDQGLKPRDIAGALRLTPEAVESLIAEVDAENTK